MNQKNTLKEKAIALRKKGLSYQQIKRKLNIANSTMNGWLTGIKLTDKQKQRLYKNWQKALIKARQKAVIVNRQAKKTRLKKINDEVDRFLHKVKFNNEILEIFLCALFLGEGFKLDGKTAMGSADPKILKGFITLLRKLYGADEKKFRGAIYARADQNPESLIKYWSRWLKIPPKRFQKTHLDKRTVNKKTYPGYKGVCAVYYYDTAIQRRLLFMGEKMLKYILSLEP